MAINTEVKFLLDNILNSICEYLHVPRRRNHIIRIHTKKLELLGEISFPLNIKNWHSIIDQKNEDLITIIDHIAVNQSLSNISQTTLEPFITHLKCESQNWGVSVNNVKIIKDNVHFYFKKPIAFCKTIHDCLSMGQSYGAIEQGPKVLFHIFNEEQYCDNSAEMTLTHLRLITLKKVAQKLTEFKLNPLQDSNIIEMKLTTKRNSDTDILCGNVLNENGKKDSTTSAEELIRKRSADMRLMAEHKYGLRVKSSELWKEYFEKLGVASVTIELLQNKPHKNVKVSLNDLSSVNKGASFIFYNCARLSTLFKEFEKRVNDGIYPQLTSLHNVDFSLLNQPEEWELLYVYIMQYPFMIRSCIQDIDKGIVNPHYLVSFLSNMCSVFSVYYRRIRILVAPKQHLIPTLNARIYLLRSLENVFHKSLELLNIDPIKEM